MIDGLLHVLGNAEMSGNVQLGHTGKLIVDGKRTIKGKYLEVPVV